MKTRLELTAQDLTTLLSSLMRGALLQSGKAHFLFADCRNAGEQTPMLPGLSGLDAEGLRSVAEAFSRMLYLDRHAAEGLLALPTLGAWAGHARQLWHAGPGELVFMTSGSTGEPTACHQSFALLEQEIRAQGEIFRGASRIVSLVPAHHIYGFLFSILLPKVLGIPVADLPPAPSESGIGELQSSDLVVAFPMFWKHVAALSRTLPPGIRGVTSTGPCPADTIRALLAKGLERMTEVYGSSETGGLGTRHDPGDAYTLLPFWNRHAGGSPELLERTLPDGRTDGPVPAPDFLQWETERTFRPMKRQDKAVQVAGVNVYPHKVADCIRSHPMVRDCAVRPMRPEEGQRLKAFIVMRAGMSESEARRELKAWLQHRLSSAEMPKSLTFGPSLPANSMGKDADWD